jgi:hypothetical protein
MNLQIIDFQMIVNYNFILCFKSIYKQMLNAVNFIGI